MSGAGHAEGRPELVRARKRMGMSQDAIAETLWVSPTTWSRWERGRQEIRPVYRARMAEVFGVDPAEVERWVEGGAPVDTEAWLVPDFSDLSPAATVEAAGRLWRCDVDPERRHVLAALPFVPAALGGWLSAWSYGAPVTSAARQGSGPVVGLSDVRRVVEARQAFGQMDRQFGAGLVRPAVVDYLNTAVAPLLRGRYDDKVGAELMTAAAAMTQMAGWTAFDLNYHGQAQHYFGQALKLAKIGDDSLTGAWVLATMTHQAVHLEQGAQAVWLARAAVDTARRAEAPPRVMAMLLIGEARATAMQARPAETGDVHSAKQVERLLTEAERAYAQGATDRDPAWVAWNDEPELTARMSRCWKLLGDYRRAADCAELAVRELTTKRPRAAQINQVSVAEAYLGMGEVEQAVDSARAAVPMARSLTSARSVERIRKFSARLEPYGTTVQVREFRAYLDSEFAS
ncbi:transcriptional regulator with XRE-family HTH domain/tetratricopeptide (TPR) repeat protein [Streptosporangium album]|uniref:Transcriptional regulator with XRE-family HTH domain/tetratricopeptide (TPR) repeat protein n=1 Tax=Streptosporangium album TaxID=47479 RepID=A0A7W7S2W4_9ACTN|nr:helix-turn-helix transcriptional regulator [Streptosporangium album]MBB4942248.1 transcriptional regulator with XRE-family HTH domain/tetratricopeptide (TPR) repeat protein [Streptosporangium album]